MSDQPLFLVAHNRRHMKWLKEQFPGVRVVLNRLLPVDDEKEHGTNAQP